VVAVKRCSDWIILLKLIYGNFALNVISAFVSQVGHNENTTRMFQEGLEDLVRSVRRGKNLFIEGYFNGPMVTSNTCFKGIRRRFGYGPMCDKG
jgi:hypothetical protein